MDLDLYLPRDKSPYSTLNRPEYKLIAVVEHFVPRIYISLLHRAVTNVIRTGGWCHRCGRPFEN